MKDIAVRTARRFGGIGLVLILAGCASLSPEARLRAGLIEAGLSPHMAGCMAEKMADRLSITQLRRLQSLASLRDEDIGQIPLDRYLHRLRALGDPEIVAVTGKAALRCAL
jgi:hypothetical protein